MSSAGILPRWGRLRHRARAACVVAERLIDLTPRLGPIELSPCGGVSTAACLILNRSGHTPANHSLPVPAQGLN